MARVILYLHRLLEECFALSFLVLILPEGFCKLQHFLVSADFMAVRDYFLHEFYQARHRHIKRVALTMQLSLKCSVSLDGLHV